MTTADGQAVVAPKELILPSVSTGTMNGSIFISGGVIHYISGAAVFKFSSAIASGASCFIAA